MRFLSQATAASAAPRLRMLSVLCLAAASAAFTVAAASALPQALHAAHEAAGWLNLTVIHTNDVHSRVDPANLVGVRCSEADIAAGNCYGGTARHKTVIERLRRENKNSLLLDGGDEFQGTLFYTYYKGNVTAEVMNELGYDLATIGNHEWDNGPANLGRYWPKLKFPVVCANVDLTKYPELDKWVKPYHIFEDLGIAVIGYITNTTGDISNAGPNIAFTDPIPAVQKYVDELERKGIKRIFGLSHNGYGPDMELAAKTHGIDLIVGGHSHSYLGDPENPNYEGPYPTVIKNLKGENTLVVQAFCWGRYIGHLDVVFNPDGKIVHWEGAPILVENSIPANPRLLNRIDGWRSEFEEWGQTVLGVATSEFDQGSCKQRECTMGNLVADAMLEHARTPIAEDVSSDVDKDNEEENQRPWTDLAFINSGGIRSGLPEGNVTIEIVMTVSPFGNGLVQTQMTGDEILAMLEAVSAGKYRKSQKLVTSNIQVAGLRYTFDSSRPLAEQHLIKVEYQGKDKVWREINRKERYWVVTLDFVLNGGDNILENKDGRKEIKLGLLDQLLMDYIQSKMKITPYLDGRIKDIAPGKGNEQQQQQDEDKWMAISDKRERIPNVWPATTPEHIRSRYPGGVEEMLEDYRRLREAGLKSSVEVESSFDDTVFEDQGSKQDVWA